MPSESVPPKPATRLGQDAFYIMLVLLHGERHGYAIMREANERSGGTVVLQAGALYRQLRRMLDDGLVVESLRRPAADADDERRRYYRVTPLGRRVLAAEAQRMASLAGEAKAALRRGPAPA
ncbi:MAG: PadR family transcriptional regulator [Gemmatimonadaceae bacterium]